MRTRSRYIAAIGLLGLATGLVPLSAPAAEPPGSGGSDVLIEPEHLARCLKRRVKPKERRFIAKHNAAREARGLSPLRLDVHLGKVARVHTREMTRKATLHHTSTTRLSRRVTRWSTLGENVGVGGTVSSLFNAFMNSPSHRDNVLYSKFNYIGVGTKTADGRLWVTVIFEARDNPGTPLC